MNEMKMDNDATVLGLFPTPVYTSEIPPELSTTCNYFDTVKQKEGDLNSAEMDQAVKIIAGTARSMGIEVEN